MILKLRRSSLENIKWSIFIFIIIFAPPFMPYPHLALAVMSGLLLLSKYGTSWRKVLGLCSMKGWLMNILAFAMYIMIVPLSVSLFCDDIVDGSHYLTIINRFGVLLFVVVPCVGLFLCGLYRKGLDERFFIETIIYAGMIEGCCAILAFLSPRLKGFFISLMQRFVGYGLYENTWYLTVRAYGFSRNLLDLFGLGIALIAGIAFFYGVAEKRKFIIYSLVIAAATFLNSRTGLIIYLIAIVYSLIYLAMTGHKRVMFKALVSIGIMFMGVYYIFKMIKLNSYTYNWLNTGINSVLYFFRNKTFQGGSSDSMMNLFVNQSWQLPRGFRAIIGTGHTLYQAKGYAHSDVGYINDIWLAGIIGCIFLYGFIFMNCIYIVKNSNYIVFKFVSIYLLIATMVFNIKGTVLGYNPGAVVIFLLMFGMKFLIEFRREKRGYK